MEIIKKTSQWFVKERYLVLVAISAAIPSLIFLVLSGSFDKNDELEKSSYQDRTSSSAPNTTKEKKKTKKIKKELDTK